LGPAEFSDRTEWTPAWPAGRGDAIPDGAQRTSGARDSVTFATLTFILFLPTVFALHWSFRGQRARALVLLGASYFFYSWWDWRFSLLMLGASLMDYFAGMGMVRVGESPWRKRILILSFVGNLGMLGLFKYFNFFAANLQALFHAVGLSVDLATLNVVLPAGISFYTFQTMSYTIEIYRGQLKPTRDLISYLAFVSFFPHLVAGPIMRANVLLPQIEADRTFDPAMAVDGCRQMLWGLFKKMALADALAMVVDRIYLHPEHFNGPQLAFATLCFSFQIYCDFSAYSDMAIGTAKLFGVKLIRNFAYPYFSQSMQEFWRRWHISLSTWFRDYVFIPLGGSRSSPWRTAWNAMVTFLLSGLWHGASWNFVIWGGINGLACAPTIVRGEAHRISRTDVPGGDSMIPSPGVVLRILGTFAVTCLAWVFFRAFTLHDALLILTRMARDAAHLAAYRVARADVLQQKPLFAALAFFFVVEWICRRWDHPLQLGGWPRPLRWGAYTGLLWVTLYLAPGIPGHFIYFQF
jgi:D-alanyl-lipoteichoic acid acyltransferase DltB (MBOAT superfamily)